MDGMTFLFFCIKHFIKYSQIHKFHFISVESKMYPFLIDHDVPAILSYLQLSIKKAEKVEKFNCLFVLF